jgi:hypothetical protein
MIAYVTIKTDVEATDLGDLIVESLKPEQIVEFVKYLNRALDDKDVTLKLTEYFNRASAGLSEK